MRVRPNRGVKLTTLGPCKSWLALRSTSVLVLGLISLCWINLILPHFFMLTHETSSPTTTLRHHDVPMNEAAALSQTIFNHPNNNMYIVSPACRPHFRLALPDGKTWTTSTKFTRLYFYHVRKAGVRYSRQCVHVETICICLSYTNECSLSFYSSIFLFAGNDIEEIFTESISPPWSQI